MENLSPTGLYRQDRLWYTGRRSEWEGFSIMDPIQQRVNSAPAWIAAAICGGLALVAGVVALIYPDTDVVELACSFGDSNSCNGIVVHRFALLIAGTFGIA